MRSPAALVDGADMLVVLADDFHMLADLAEQAALLLPLLAPAAEVVFELRLMLAAIVVIVAVEIADVAVAPAAVMRVEVAIVDSARAGEARPAIFVAAVGRLRTIIVASDRQRRSPRP